MKNANKSFSALFNRFAPKADPIGKIEIHPLKDGGEGFMQSDQQERTDCNNQQDTDVFSSQDKIPVTQNLKSKQLVYLESTSENIAGQMDITNEANLDIPIQETIPEMDVTGCKEDILGKTDEQQALLNNKAFVKLVEECADIMDEFDGYAERLETEEGKAMSKLVVERLHEAMERSGLSRIGQGDGFSILRHIPVPMMRVPEGQPLAQLLSYGLAIDKRVFRKAKVKIQKTQDDDM